MYLRDPRIGIPAGLQAVGGPDSIQLSLDPNRSYRLKGYYVYRAPSAEETFGRLMSYRWPLNSYLDTNASAGVVWHYYVTAVSEAYYPGNTVAREVESRPSEIVSADTGSVILWMPDYVGKAGETAVLQVNVEHGTGIIGAGLDLRVTYNPALWMAPPQGWGVLVGRIESSYGRLLENQSIYIHSRLDVENEEEEDEVWITNSYTMNGINSDPYYQENFVLGDLPAGYYRVNIPYIWTVFTKVIEIRPGEITYITFQGWRGINITEPPEPEVLFTPAP